MKNIGVLVVFCSLFVISSSWAQGSKRNIQVELQKVHQDIVDAETTIKLMKQEEKNRANASHFAEEISPPTANASINQWEVKLAYLKIKETQLKMAAIVEKTNLMSQQFNGDKGVLVKTPTKAELKELVNRNLKELNAMSAELKNQVSNRQKAEVELRHVGMALIMSNLIRKSGVDLQRDPAWKAMESNLNIYTASAKDVILEWGKYHPSIIKSEAIADADEITYRAGRNLDY